MYGRQLYPGDYHVVPMRTAEVCEFLRGCGFHDIKFSAEPEPGEHNTFLTARKGTFPITRELLLRKEIFKR